MTLEDLIYSRMTTVKDLTDLLAEFDDDPAVFYQSAPGDKADGWNGKKQYPRLDFTVDMQANAERQTSGQAQVNIWCLDSGAPPEALEPVVRQALCGIFLQPDNTPYCLAWARSENFEGDRQKDDDPKVIGITLLFDIYAFPVQITSDPDPILALNHFISRWAADAVVIGKDELPSQYLPQAGKPAFYFRVMTLERAEETNTVVWMNAILAGHIFASDADEEMQWLRALVDTLALAGEVIMLDNSPMFLQSISADSSLDRLSSGQLRLSARFGILRARGYNPLNVAVIDYKTKEE